jgi:hypothetical protein
MKVQYFDSFQEMVSSIRLCANPSFHNQLYIYTFYSDRSGSSKDKVKLLKYA